MEHQCFLITSFESLNKLKIGFSIKQELQSAGSIVALTMLNWFLHGCKADCSSLVEGSARPKSLAAYPRLFSIVGVPPT